MNTTAGPNFCNLPPELSQLDSAAAVIIPVPYDRSSTWKKGSDRGPEAILRASHQIEFYDIFTHSEPCRQGIATLEAIKGPEDPELLAHQLQEIVKRVVGAGQLPIVLGGDHSVSIGPIRGAAAAVPGLTILQIDAHGDTRESYAGSAYNHACVMARAREICPIVQVGIRALDIQEVEDLDLERVVFAHQINGPGAEGDWIERVIGHLGEKVYVTIDLDAFDPAYLPATGTPEPGGLDWYQVNSLLGDLARQREIVGFDVVELLPTPGHWASEFLAAKLVYRFLAEILAASTSPEDRQKSAGQQSSRPTR